MLDNAFRTKRGIEEDFKEYSQDDNKCYYYY